MALALGRTLQQTSSAVLVRKILHVSVGGFALQHVMIVLVGAVQSRSHRHTASFEDVFNLQMGMHVLFCKGLAVTLLKTLSSAGCLPQDPDKPGDKPRMEKYEVDLNRLVCSCH